MNQWVRSGQNNLFDVLQVKGSVRKRLKGVRMFPFPPGKNKSAIFHHLTTGSCDLTANCQWTSEKLIFSGSVHKHTMLWQSSLCDVTQLTVCQTCCSCCLTNYFLPLQKTIFCVPSILDAYFHRVGQTAAVLMRHLWLWDVIFLQRLEVVNHTHTVNSAVTGKFSSPKTTPQCWQRSPPLTSRWLHCYISAHSLPSHTGSSAPSSSTTSGYYRKHKSRLCVSHICGSAD